MKVKLLAIAAIILGFSACGGRSANNQNSHNPETCTEHNHNTHTHADGTVHSDHAPEQESFKVQADTIIVVTDTVKAVTHTHSHNGQTHTH